MTNLSVIDRAFNAATNEAIALYESGQLTECIAKARELLEDPAIPRYHRIRMLVLLSATVPDWEEAHRHRVDAEVLWRAVRNYHPVGENERTDEALRELRENLDEIKKSIADEKEEALNPTPRDPLADVEGVMAAYRAAVRREMEAAKAKQDDAEGFVAADARALNMTIEELHKLDVRKAYGQPLSAPEGDCIEEGAEAMDVEGLESVPFSHSDGDAGDRSSNIFGIVAVDG